MLRRNVCLFILILLVASACNVPFSPTTAVAHTPTAVAPSSLPSNTLVAPTATQPVIPTFTFVPPTAVPPTLTPAPQTNASGKTLTPTKTPQLMTLKIFLIGVNDNGVAGKLVGCGDSAVAVNVEVPHTTGVLRAALDKLLSIKDQNYGQSGLYNALYQSNLKIGSLAIKDGLATIHLTGKLILGGECDNPRVQAELEETARQFSTVKNVSIYINNVPLKKVLSLK